MRERPPDADREAVTRLLGREPLGLFRVVVRNDRGEPVVLKNHPLLEDGRPMPTRFWLVGAHERRVVSRRESAQGVARAQAAVDPDALAACHATYARERDTEMPKEHAGPRPMGGVGGTR